MYPSFEQCCLRQPQPEVSALSIAPEENEMPLQFERLSHIACRARYVPLGQSMFTQLGHFVSYLTL